MKIALISPNRSNLQAMSTALEADSHSIVLIEGGKSRIRAVAEQEQPDLMLVESMGFDVGDLGQVEYVTTHHPKITIILICAVHTPEFLLNAMRAGVREVLPSPVSPGTLQAATNRVAVKLSGPQTRNTGRILAFIGCKGGAGATFLATNFGYHLAEINNVLLIDLNLQLGDALSFVYDGQPAMTVANVARDITRLDASFLMASTVKITPNYSILAAPEDPSQAMEIRPDHLEAILNVATTQYDFVLLDMGRTLDSLSIKALDRAYRIFPVMQASLPSLRNAKKLLTVFSSLGYSPEKVELIVNRFDKRGEIGLDHIKRLLGSISMHTVPNSFKEVNASINHGNPLAEMTRTNVVTKTLSEFALALSPKQQEKRGLIGRLFRRA
jgi:pilus assembly protein CpaE